MSNLLFYRASAGSGKTHTLVVAFLRSALRHPDAFKHILMVTFTNLASQEMKQRILSYLYRLSRCESSYLLDELSDVGLDASAIRSRSRQVLSLILEQYDDFAVATLDSFFYQVVQLFAREFGLQGDVLLEMDQELVLEDVVGQLMSQWHERPLLCRCMVEFALYKLHLGQSWHIKKDIYNFSKEILSARFRSYEASFLELLDQGHTLQDFITSNQRFLRDFETTMQRIGKDALEAIHHAHVHFQDFAYGIKGVIGYFVKLAQGISFKPTKRALLAAEAVQYWIGQVGCDKKRILVNLIEEKLQPLLLESLDLYDRVGKKYYTALLSAQNIYVLSIITSFLDLLRQYRRDHNVLLMEDVAWLLYQVVANLDAPFFYEHVSSQYHHVLIDEFQDLSLLQWYNIKPLIENSLSQGYDCVMVGDIKQAIYRWRGSYGQYLSEQVASSFPAHILKRLTTNRRSSQTIIGFNNHILQKSFNQLMGYFASKIDALDPSIKSGLRSKLDAVKATYGDIRQDGIHQGLPCKGGVEITCLKSSKEQEYELLVDEEIIQLIEKFKKEDIPAKDIVFLVRNNSQVSHITNLLQKRSCGDDVYPVISDDARDLWKNTAVKVLIYALHYLVDDKDLIGLLSLVQTYRDYVWGDGVIFHNYDYKSMDRSSIEMLLPEAFVRQKYRLKHLPIHICVEELIQIFIPSTRDIVALSFFQSLVLDFLIKEDGSVGSFLFWCAKRLGKVKLPSSDGYGAIRVMTIHQAKGLEFNVVVLPFCDWPLDYSTSHRPLVWVKNQSKSDFNHFPIFPLRYGGMMQDSSYAEDYFNEHIECYMDNFNLLYVALTRAKYALYAWMPVPKSSTDIDTVADLVYHAVVSSQDIFNGQSSRTCGLRVSVQEYDHKVSYAFYDGTL